MPAAQSPDAFAGISFDEQDRDLFRVDDRRLRADALRYSLLPKLLVVLNEAVRQIREIYGVEAFEDSIVFRSPNFRTKRENELKLDYEWASLGLGGQRRKNKWLGVSRKDGKEVQIVPFLYLFSLDVDGLSVAFNPDWLIGLSHSSREKLFGLHFEYEEIIHRITYFSGLVPSYYYDAKGKSCEPLATPREHYQSMLKDKCYATAFESVWPRPYPMSNEDVFKRVRSFITFFPVYDSYLQIAMGRPPRIMELVGRLNAWLRAQDEKEAQAAKEAQSEPAAAEAPAVDLDQARAAAAQRLPVMPSLRWQVFLRDDWRCVACGRDGSAAGVILHVDHIVPRSRGGADSLDNYQTLCWECNLGKGNRDSTNLRQRRRRARR